MLGDRMLRVAPERCELKVSQLPRTCGLIVRHYSVLGDRRTQDADGLVDARVVHPGTHTGSTDVVPALYTHEAPTLCQL
jgi:hypothetical protein